MHDSKWTCLNVIMSLGQSEYCCQGVYKFDSMCVSVSGCVCVCVCVLECACEDNDIIGIPMLTLYLCSLYDSEIQNFYIAVFSVSVCCD